MAVAQYQHTVNGPLDHQQPEPLYSRAGARDNSPRGSLPGHLARREVDRPLVISRRRLHSIAWAIVSRD